MQLEIVVACDLNGGIGRDGNIPWNIPQDMQRFKRLTTWGISDPSTETPKGRPEKLNSVIMGRKTWDSLPEKYRPLPDRLNIVISSIPQLTETHDVIWVTSLADAIAVAEKHTDRVFVIGGAMVYRDAMQLPGEKLVHLTRINKTHTCDKFFLLDSTRVNSLITHETNPGYSFHEYLVA